MKFQINEEITLVMLYNYLKACYKSVELYQTIETLKANSDLALTIEFCNKQVYADFAILIDNNKDLVLTVCIMNNTIDSIHVDNIDAAMIANNAIEFALTHAGYYGIEN